MPSFDKNKKICRNKGLSDVFIIIQTYQTRLLKYNYNKHHLNRISLLNTVCFCNTGSYRIFQKHIHTVSKFHPIGDIDPNFVH